MEVDGHLCRAGARSFEKRRVSGMRSCKRELEKRDGDDDGVCAISERGGA